MKVINILKKKLFGRINDKRDVNDERHEKILQMAMWTEEEKIGIKNAKLKCDDRDCDFEQDIYLYDVDNSIKWYYSCSRKVHCPKCMTGFLDSVKLL